eukprot:CAMPEP_0205813310 /NCGR_PEP_ID=MMETSP0205-20121125/17956_1 /ASSEMBLY_ACC=CAM_ASM_000278 /TAXON_ID=36767 /ORGANISM="Euplotes focardii, Strain TN1" /LENGTH=163 /DNA_ID=CAMNT_0053095245 /DNA_START=51 /DNA_END=538 /DNA_ORIENTATION=+
MKKYADTLNLKKNSAILRTEIDLKSSIYSKKGSNKNQPTAPVLFDKSEESISGLRGFSTGFTSFAKTSKAIAKNVSVTIDDTDEVKSQYHVRKKIKRNHSSNSRMMLLAVNRSKLMFKSEIQPRKASKDLLRYKTRKTSAREKLSKVSLPNLRSVRTKSKISS